MMPLLEIYNLFSGIVVKHLPNLAEEVTGRTFDLLFKDWDLGSRISAPIKLQLDYLYNPSEDF
jgi:hypothetical protein